ncbi:MAG: hypothetical protein V4510_03915 [bacterium]
MHAAVAALAALLVAASLAGCSTERACPETNAHVRADSGGTEDIHVTRDDGTAAVIHLAKATIYRGSGASCTPSTSSAIFIGTELDLHVTAWAESDPVQATPDIVILR